ncbi:MAG: permease-like cell division protein FtsX [Turicibacter sp.]|nr:permease-like cell division protein FtsX [Turicibacter sp.]
MSFRRSKYFLGEAIRGLVRNRLMSMASILTVASCILVVSVFYSLAANITLFLEQLEGTVGMTVFVENEVNAEELHGIYRAILDIDNVSHVVFVPHEEAFEEAVVQLGANMLDGIPIDTFPRSFNIEIYDLRYHDEVASSLEALIPMGIEDIRVDRDTAVMLTNISHMVQWASIVLIGILGLISIIIITNTIRITVNARHTEINIMKYVGATDWFIRWPFLIEGMLIGLIGSLIPIALVWSGYAPAVGMAQSIAFLDEIIEFRSGYEIFVVLFPLVLVVGVVIGALGSLFSIRRHLHV